jgi:histidinol-phosphate aminotransferase
MKYWNSTLKAMTEYIPGEQPDNIDDFIKLNTNENAFPPSPAVLQALREACNGNLRKYPNPDAQPVREEFARQLGAPFTAENIFVANGSDEIFTLIFRGFVEKTSLAAFAYPSYSLYYTMSEANGIPYEKIQMTDDFEIDFPQFLKKPYSLVILTNPNNPTGTGIPLNAIKDFAKKFKGLLVIDEAYVDFYGETSISLVKEYDNIIVTRSFSKSYSLAGLRVGLAIAHKDIIRGFIKLKDSYNIDRLAATGALAALKDEKTFRYNLQMVVNNKEYLEERLAALGFETVPSKANFIFTRHPGFESSKLYLELKKRNILVRYFKGDIQDRYLRITVGSMMEIKKLIEELSDITGAQ